MSLAEKIGQMTQVSQEAIVPDDVAAYHIGSVLSGGGGNPEPNTPHTWARMVRGFQEAAVESRLGVPLLYGVDAVHGHSNLKGAVIFPHNIGLGATRAPELVETVGRITALEMLATNVHWTFAPCLAVPQDIRWGRTYEGFGQQPDLVGMLGAAYVRGLQGGKGPTADGSISTLACAKHFVGDGATGWGTTPRYDWIQWWNWGNDQRWQIDQGDADLAEDTLRALHMTPYGDAIAAGVGSIMVSYSSWRGEKMHGHRYLLTEVLKGELGFDGFLVSDWMGIDQLDADYERAVATAINAGLDMVMVPIEYRRFIMALTALVEAGEVPQARIDDAVRRILKVKARLGLFEHPFGDETLLEEIGSPAHRDVARQAVRRSLVLLKNEGQVLPLARDIPVILIGGQAADDIGLQCGGWTIEWMGRSGSTTAGASLLEAIKKMVSPGTEVVYHPQGRFAEAVTAEVGLVVLAEEPYAEGEGDRAALHLTDEDLVLLARMRQRCKRLVVILFCGRPLIITDQIAEWDAFVAAWLPGTEGEGMTDVLFGDYPFTGRLPYAWPRTMEQVPRRSLEGSDAPPLFPYGAGL
ncbi:MAG: glycoside hydrolase family 3 protein [Chloroflexota bacterium]